MMHKDKRNDKEKKQETQEIDEQKVNISEQKDEKQASKQPHEITLKIGEFNNLKQEAEKSKDYFDKLLRLQAEFDNAKKRLQKERLEFIKYANEEMILELLGILDDLERSVEVAEVKHENPKVFLKGIEMILAHLYEMLKRRGVSVIDAKGKYFDPNLHEAMMQIETDEFSEHTVVEELQKGYMLEDRVIRTAKVKVAKAKKPETRVQ